MKNRGNPRDFSNLTYDKTQIPIALTNETAAIMHDVSDIFYLPRSKFQTFHYLSNLFNKIKIFVGKN